MSLESHADKRTKADAAAPRLLIIRFSSFGDIIQAVSVPQAFRSRYPNAHITWLVRSDFKSLLESHPAIDEVISFPRHAGLRGLLRLAWQLGGRNNTHIYDAHNNVRSKIVLAVIGLRLVWQRLIDLGHPSRLRLGTINGANILIRSKNRWRRFRFFRLGDRSALPMPFRGILSFLEPLKPWGISPTAPPPPQFHLAAEARQGAVRMLKGLTEHQNQNEPPLKQPPHASSDFTFDIALVPSAAWKMKRWPIENWRQLIALLPEYRFAILGGPEDHFCEELAAIAPERVTNLAGKLHLQESAAILEHSRLVISGDTGLLHVSDQLGRPTLALIGPTAFGYTTHPQSEVLEVDLPCKPCSKDGRGRCRNSVYQKCLINLTPEFVANRARIQLHKTPMPLPAMRTEDRP